MNILLFFSQIILMITFAFYALKLGEKALGAFVILLTLLSNFFVLKQIELFSLTVTATDAYTICSIFCLNLIQEYFGKEKALEIVKINFFILFLFAVLSFIHLQYIPSPSDSTQSSYERLLKISPRIFFSSMTAYFFSQKLDLWLFQFFRRKQLFSSFVRAGLVSTGLSQVVDTVLFSFLALYGEMQALNAIIGLSLIIKLLTLVGLSPMLYLSKRFIKNHA